MAKQSSGRVIITDDINRARRDENVVGPVWCVKHHFSGPWPCDCPPGPQVQALSSLADEILYGGARGGGKTEIGLLFMIKGNPPEWSTGLPVDVSYLNSPLYRGLILRENLVDMEDFLDRAEQLYKRGGADFHYDSPITITWPSGAKFVVSYLSDEKNQGKVLGPSYHRVIWEQLEQIKKEEVYKRLFGSMRSKVPGIRTQLLSNANPGSGPGQAWIVNRFIDLYRPDGKLVQPGESWVNPENRRVRVFIPARIKDNPYFMQCPTCGSTECVDKTHQIPSYIAGMMEQPEYLRKAWVDGDWKSLAGGYYPEFRPTRLPGEPDNALHCLPAAELGLQGWWNTWLSCDWGRSHPCCTLWFKENPNTKQLIVYREFVTAQQTANEVGAAIALRCLDDMKHLESKVLVMALSHDAFGHKESSTSLADQIKAGIDSVMGPKSTFIMVYNEHEKSLPPDQAFSSLIHRRKEVESACRIVVIPENNRRIDGWERVRDYLRWKPLQEGTNSAFDPEYAKNLAENAGIIPYLEYMKLFESQSVVLPKLLISTECRQLIKSLQNLIFARGDKEGTGDAEKMDGDDPADTLRYGIMAYEPRDAKMPERIYVDNHVQKMLEGGGFHSPTSLVHAAMKAKVDYDKTMKPTTAAFTPRRSGRSGSMAIRGR